jgi:hypothetical protein
MARSLLDDCASALAELVSDLAERLQLQSQEFRRAKTGGMLERLDCHLRKAAPLEKYSNLQLSPAEAAAHLALQVLQTA